MLADRGMDVTWGRLELRHQALHVALGVLDGHLTRGNFSSLTLGLAAEVALQMAVLAVRLAADINGVTNGPVETSESRTTNAVRLTTPEVEG